MFLEDLPWRVAQEAATLVQALQSDPAPHRLWQMWSEHFRKPICQRWAVNDDTMPVSNVGLQLLHPATNVQQSRRKALTIH